MTQARRGLAGLTSKRTPAVNKRVGGGGRGRGNSKAKTVGTVAKESWLDLSIAQKYTDNRPLWLPGREPEKGWTPSSMVNSCDRLLILGLLGFRGEPFPTHVKRIFEMGQAIEKLWQKRFTEFGILIGSNVRAKFDGPPKLSYEYDVMIKHPFERGRRMIGEIKSCNDRSFKLLPQRTLDPVANLENLSNIGDSYFGGQVKKYLLQLLAYLYAQNVEEGFLLFDNKNDSKFRDFYISLEVGRDMIVSQFERMNHLNEYWVKQVVPPCTHDPEENGFGSKKNSVLCGLHDDEEVALNEVKEWTKLEDLDI
ncbi:hypothetical protein LCGC14_0264940 [marine sediment metagenome]|uniref:YqaJ viral recombinase domain-containing protein n=1 Tax=marine sediment metagenome TaxID=412755 RepID=A0A0F9WLL4_9ZZZZ